MIPKKTITIQQSNLNNTVVITLPASKSISNRALIVNALSENPAILHNLSEARDTQTMIRLLDSAEKNWDVKDAGTTMRFLTAFAAITKQKKTLTGTIRMQQRPIGILIDALIQLGADINYEDKEGYPPHSIISFTQKTNEISMPGNVSSQYISALLMIAPILPSGLTLNLKGKIGSKPYIEMTLSIMEYFGIRHSWKDKTIHIKPQNFKAVPLTIEPDWSAASYWYSFVALSKNGSVVLNGLGLNSLQGDSVLYKFMNKLGVNTTFTKEGAHLSKVAHQPFFNYDFSDCPDLAQTIAVICAAKGINAEFKGLKSLKIKETDRVLALQNELEKIGASIIEKDDTWFLSPSKSIPSSVCFTTYDDHRMAMAFAPLCLLMEIEFDDKDVVNKSYPNFWEDVQNAVH